MPRKIIFKIASELFPILLMITLIPFIINDFFLTLVYMLIILISLYYKRDKNDLLIFSLGFVLMIFFEFIFIATGVEKFTRTSLFGVMPLWLPFLWAYSFIVMKRLIKLIDAIK